MSFEVIKLRRELEEIISAAIAENEREDAAAQQAFEAAIKAPLEAEIARLRRERIEQEAVNLEMGGEIAKLRRELAEIGGAFSQSEKYREDAHSQLAVIVDEAFGPQEVLPLPNLLSRLERLLTERARQHEDALRELKEWKEWADHHSAWSLLFAERPPDAEIRTTLGELLDVATGEEMARVHGERATALMDLEAAKRELGEALAKLELIDDHRRADSDQISRLETALRDLIDSADASMTRDTSVLCDIDAARAVLGGRS